MCNVSIERRTNGETQTRDEFGLYPNREGGCMRKDGSAYGRNVVGKNTDTLGKNKVQ